ncbi:VOC family protein [soil metagenome]
MRLTQTRLLVRDYAASFHFWRDTAGLTASFGEGAEGESYASFETEPGELAIYRADEMDKAIGRAASEEQRGSDQVVISLEVDDVDAQVSQLERRGVSFVSPPTDQRAWGMRVAHFRDPDDHLIEVYTPLASEPA